MTTRLRLLGRARVFDGQRWLDAPHDKRFGLLAYLACAGDAVKRERLAFLFWPDIEEARARRDLRHLIYRTKALSFASALEIATDSLAWPVETDVESLSRTAGQRDWAAVVALYDGQFLEGLYLADSPEFMSWVALERESHHASWRGAMIERADELESASRHVEAAVLLKELVEDDDLDEDALRLYLRNCYQGGRRDEALGAYERFTRRLKEGLGLEPLPAIREVVAALQGGLPLANPTGVGAVQAAATAVRESSGSVRNLPSEITPFIGRKPELSELVDMLKQASCRLLTLVGPGGIGKTRLAQEAAVAIAANYGDGVTFVPLAAVGDSAWLASAVANALSLSFYDQREPETQLLGYLRDKEMLLLLDNLEHLPAASQLIGRLLESCPRLQVMATSRERLNLARESLYHVRGMSLGAEDNAAWPDGSDAAHLFLRCARRVRPDVLLDEEDRASVVHICQLVGGTPLGIELAAAWLETLSCREIAEKMAEGFDFLENPLNDAPERHRSLRDVFEHSWRLLTEQERTAFKHLSVFRGGFTREAAAALGVALRPLRSMLEKSLVTRDASGRFDLHELVKQYAAEKLGEIREEEHEGRDRHAAFYGDFLHERDRWLRGGERQQAALQEIAKEIDNVRWAWDWAVKWRDSKTLDRASSCLRFYCQTRGLYQEGEAAFRLSAECVTKESLTHGKLLLFQALFTFWLGRQYDAQEIVERSLIILACQAAPPEVMANANFLLGLVQRQSGELGLATHQFNKVLELATEGGDAFFEARALQGLGRIAESLGELDEAERRYRQCIAVFGLAEERYGLASALFNLGRLLEGRGWLEPARLRYLEGLAAARAVGSDLRIAEALVLLGRLGQRQGEYQRAQGLYGECLAMVEGREDEPFRIATKHCLVGLAETAGSQGRYQESFHYFHAAVRRGIGADDLSMVASSLVGIAAALARLGMEDKAVTLLAFTLAQPSIEEGIRERAGRLFSALTAQFPEPAVAPPQEQVRSMLIATIPGLLSDWQRQIEAELFIAEQA